MGRNFTPEVLQALDAPFRNALAPRQGLVFDGTALASIVLATDFGAASWSIVVRVTKTSTGTVFAKAVNGSATANPGLLMFDDGSLRQIRIKDGTTGVSLDVPSLAATDGVTRDYAVTCSAGGTLTVYLNGVLEVSASAVGVGSISNGLPLTLGGMSAGYLSGTIRLLGIYNRALSATEVSALYREGAPAAADFRDSAQPFGTSLVTGNSSNFAGAGGWSGSGVAVSGGQMTVTGYALLYSAGVIKGKRYRMVMEVVSNPTTIIFDDGGTARYSTITGTGSTTVEFLCGSSGLVELFPTAGGTMVIDNFTIYPIGLLCAPESNAPGNGLVWNDQSGNGAHILLPHVSGKMTGVTWALPGGGRNSVSGTTNTLGNQQIFGAGCVVFDAVGGNPTCRIARVFARARTGTPSVTLGYSSGGNQYATATTLAIGWKVVAAGAESVAATTSLWAGSSSADVVEWMVMIEPIKV